VILARRARFVAAALAAAGMSAAAGCTRQPGPQGCLSPPMEVMVEPPPDAGDEVDPDAATGPSTRARSEGGAGEEEPERRQIPRICLSEY
jgi:hypothetical protein